MHSAISHRLKMLRAATTGLVGCILLLSQPVLAERVELAPANNWWVDYEGESCVLRRDFGEEGQQVFFEWRQFRPGDDAQIIVSSADFGLTSRAPRLTFEPDTASYVSPSLPHVRTHGNRDGIIHLGNLRLTSEREANAALHADGLEPPSWPAESRAAREREITGFLVERAFADDLFLRTGPMDMPLDAMRTCMGDLLEHWGFDAEIYRTLSRPAAPDNLERWAIALEERYPSRMLRRGRQALVWVRVNIDTSGIATACNVQSNQNDPTFNSVACELMMRFGRFKPALDAQQQPVASFWVGSIIYAN